MNMDFSKISPLVPPILTTGNDVIFSGHGAFTAVGDTTVPEGVEFYMVAPLGATITDSLGQALESMEKITKLGIYSSTTRELSKVIPVIYKAGTKAPNLTLQAPNGIILNPGGPHLIGVTQDTKLSDLWVRLAPFIKHGQTIRVFWAACTAISGARNQTVYYQ